MSEPVFFESAQAFRAWLAANHGRTQELWVGFHKRATGRPSLTWPESVDQALCYGWIDGLRRSIDRDAYKIRFTPRKNLSNWSAVNIRRARELIDLGLMEEAGMRAFEQRDEARSEVYSFENRHVALDPEYEQRFRSSESAWSWFQSQAPWYRRTASFWVMDAKQEATRLRRLDQLIRDSEQGRRVGPLSRPGTRTEGRKATE